MKVGARQESANLYLDINKYNEVERRLNGLMEESAEMEQYDKAISYRNQIEELARLKEAFDASPSPSTLEKLNKLLASA